jgi:hypothetical protein
MAPATMQAAAYPNFEFYENCFTTLFIDRTHSPRGRTRQRRYAGLSLLRRG